MNKSYLVALTAVAVVIAVLLLDRIARNRRRSERQTFGPARLEVVTTIERRRRDVPFVGAERRRERDTIDAVLAHAEIRRGA